MVRNLSCNLKSQFERLFSERKSEIALAACKVMVLGTHSAFHSSAREIQGKNLARSVSVAGKFIDFVFQ